MRAMITGLSGAVGKRVGTTVKIVICIIATALLVWAGSRLFHHSSPQQKPPQTLLNQLASESTASAQADLKSNDYAAYQDVEGLMARNFLHNNDLPSAEQIMNSVFSKVPEGRVTYISYSTMIQIQQAKGDKTAEKYYDQQLINLLKSQGGAVSAKQIQEQLDASQ